MCKKFEYIEKEFFYKEITKEREFRVKEERGWMGND